MLSLDDISNAIQSFDYGYIDTSNKPSIMSHLSLETNSLKQSGKCIGYIIYKSFLQHHRCGALLDICH